MSRADEVERPAVTKTGIWRSKRALGPGLATAGRASGRKAPRSTSTALKTRLPVALILLLSACGAGPPGWQGEDVHLVNGIWVGTETACGADDLVEECRLLVEHAMGAVDPETRSKVASAVVADLPTTFVSATGERRFPDMGAFLLSRRAVVLELADGTRLAIGLICRLPYSGDTGRLLVDEVTCKVDPLDDWRNGNVPR